MHAFDEARIFRGRACACSGRGGSNTGSLFGLKGSEDLGGRSKAVFDIENGYNINNDSLYTDTIALFYRQAWSDSPTTSTVR